MPTVTLVLATGPGFPQGSTEHRYEIDVVLDPAGNLDDAAWLAEPAPWPARRVWPQEPERFGDVQHDPASGWSLRFFPAPGQAGEEAGDAPLHGVMRAPVPLRPGEYLTIREPDGREYSFRVVSVA
jgi:hypothetical protein